MPELKYPFQHLSLKHLNGEQWDDIPGLDGAYEILNYGRIKSNRRYVERTATGGFWVIERIIKPQIRIQRVSGNSRSLYRLSATIKFEGKPVSVSIARIVSFLFNKRFDIHDRKLVVSMKDEDPFNIYVRKT